MCLKLYVSITVDKIINYITCFFQRYCDCFANGLNCQNCACLNCHNDTRHEEERTKAIAATLERNPNAFKSKMYKFG